MNITADNRVAEITHAREIDTEIARLWSEAHKLADRIEAICKRRDDNAKSATYSFNQNERRQAQLAESTAKLEAELAALRPAYQLAAEIARTYDAENYTGWTRFFLVKHIHSSQHCSSFRLTTRVGWLPDVSGLTEAEAVAAHGETLCTICYPSAPTELTTKAVDPSLCTGSGKFYDNEHKTGRENAYSSPSGYCPDCGRWNTITKTGAMRKHKVDETRRHW